MNRETRRILNGAGSNGEKRNEWSLIKRSHMQFLSDSALGIGLLPFVVVNLRQMQSFTNCFRLMYFFVADSFHREIS